MLPITANLFGLNPNKESLYMMADNAMLLLTTANTKSANSMINCHLFIGAFENSLKEKNMIAITPISMAFRMNKNSLSL